MKTDYILTGGAQQVLGLYDIVDGENGMQKMTPNERQISPQQAVVQVGNDGTAYVTSTGHMGPTGWRTGPNVPWTWLQNGESMQLGHGHKISLDQYNPTDSVFVVQLLGRAGQEGDQYQPYLANQANYQAQSGNYQQQGGYY